MRYKRIFSLVLAAAIVLSATSCAAEETDDKKRVAVIVKAVDSDFWHNVKNGVDSAAIEDNVSVTFNGPENEEDFTRQNEMIYDAVEDKVDAIVLSAIDHAESVDAVNFAVQKGVKVVLIDSGIDSTNVSQFIGTDNIAAGKAAARAAIGLFPEKSEVCIGILNFAVGTDNGDKRETGFRDYVDTIPNARIVAAATADSNVESATAAAVAILKNNPRIDVIVGFNEWMTLGVGYAIEKLGLADKVQGVGFDTNLVSVGMIETGEMDALVVQNPFAMGYLAVKSAASIVSGETPQESVLYTDVTTVTRANLFDSDIQKLLFRFN